MKSAAERAAEKIIQLNDYAISMSSVTEAISREYAELEQAAEELADEVPNAWSIKSRQKIDAVRSALAKVRGTK